MYARYPREAQQTALGGLICLLFILYALGAIQAAAQNVVGQHLLDSTMTNGMQPSRSC